MEIIKNAQFAVAPYSKHRKNSKRLTKKAAIAAFFEGADLWLYSVNGVPANCLASSIRDFAPDATCEIVEGGESIAYFVVSEERKRYEKANPKVEPFRLMTVGHILASK